MRRLILILALALLSGCGGRSLELPHEHGLGYSGDGTRLLVPAHNGFRAYAGGGWSTPDVPAHDYMGYAAVDDGFYASGHPDPRSGLRNPLGLVRSTDEGKTLQRLAFFGESDFHLMAVGWKSHAIYVLNPAPNSRLGPGIHLSVDDGRSWEPAPVPAAILAELEAMAVHPAEPATIALGTRRGLLLSRERGANLQRVGPEGRASAAHFDPSGHRLYFGHTGLYALDPGSGQVQALTAPPLERGDAITYIAANPARPQELAVATLHRHLYLSADGGQSWAAIARAGRTVNR